MKQQRVIEGKKPRGWWDKTNIATWRPLLISRDKAAGSRTLILVFLEEKFSRETVKHMKCLLEAKDLYWNTRVGSEWAGPNRGGLDCWRRGQSPGLTRLPILFVPTFGLTQGPSWWMCVYLLPKMDSSAKASGRLAGHAVSWWLPLFCLLRLMTSSVHVSSWEIPLTTRMRKMWSLCLLPQSGLSSCWPLTSKCQQERCLQLPSLGPPVSSLTPRDELWVILKRRRSTASSRNEVVERACCWPQDEESSNGVSRTSSFLCWG